MKRLRVYKIILAVSCLAIAGMVGYLWWFFTHVVRIVQITDF